ncbi:hypothetical protein CVT24_004481 [Panaeolus cyanescens]|uniref:Gelsolin-like domain-containing protein n=1 Tax=Panaeolus cyanescens TaxID=181874 RepID=A0A409YBQ3_9AGAR|nr:hypothetical protein CVT24_004481 [Panaeolus cyanescens]
MAHLTKAKVYDIEDSNIALLGSDLEKHVRQEAGELEPAWEDAGKAEGLQIWRIENFHVVPWPNERYGTFYDGDSYIVLYTFKKTPEAKSLSYDLHFWLGQHTTQDEAGTAAYKTVELDGLLHGKPIQFREVQSYESTRFLTYFPRFTCLKGGVASGFHHVAATPPLNIRKLYRITLIKAPSNGRSTLIVREVAPVAESLVEGDTYVLDKGENLLQLNTRMSAGQEKFKAAEFAQSIMNERQSQCSLEVFDEGGSGFGRFLAEFGEGTVLRKEDTPVERHDRSLFRLSDASGEVKFEQLDAVRTSLSTMDAFLLDDSSSLTQPAIYVWIGKRASLNERRLAMQYAQRYLYKKQPPSGVSKARSVAIPIVRMQEGDEPDDFLDLLL